MITPVSMLQTGLGALTGAAGAVALYVRAQTPPAGPDDWVGFSGQALLVVSGLLSIMSGVVTYQGRQLDKERELRHQEVLNRLKDRDQTIADQKNDIEELKRGLREAWAAVESVRSTKDEQIFRLLGLGEQATSALDSLAPLAREVRSRRAIDTGGA